MKASGSLKKTILKNYISSSFISWDKSGITFWKSTYYRNNFFSKVSSKYTMICYDWEETVHCIKLYQNQKSLYPWITSRITEPVKQKIGLAFVRILDQVAWELCFKEMEVMNKNHSFNVYPVWSLNKKNKFAIACSLCQL